MADNEREMRVIKRCPECGSLVTVGDDGKYRPHQEGGTGTTMCAGSNQEAVGRNYSEDAE